MSLDVYLISSSEEERKCNCPKCGHEHTYFEEEQYFEANITHNLGKMANEAGIYDALWRPDEHHYKLASQIIDILKNGISLMEKEPERFKVLSASNGWGTYEQFVPWVKKYLAACIEYPDALIKVSR